MLSSTICHLLFTLRLIGDVSLSAEDRHPADDKKSQEHEVDSSDNDVDKVTAFKFLLAGGIAGAGLLCSLCVKTWLS